MSRLAWKGEGGVEADETSRLETAGSVQFEIGGSVCMRVCMCMCLVVAACAYAHATHADSRIRLGCDRKSQWPSDVKRPNRSASQSPYEQADEAAIGQYSVAIDIVSVLVRVRLSMEVAIGACLVR